MKCPEHNLKAEYLSCNSYELCYECPKNHLFFIKIDEITNDEERVIVKMLATNPLARKIIRMLKEPKTTQELSTIIREMTRPKYIS